MPTRKKRVLVIEDSPYLAESLEDMLTLSGHTPIVTVTGTDGVAAALEHHPDLILLDIRLPDIDGYEVYRRIRADAWGATADILVLTASESVDQAAKNLGLPLDYVLFKPDWSIKELLVLIRDRLSNNTELVP